MNRKLNLFFSSVFFVLLCFNINTAKAQFWKSKEDTKPASKPKPKQSASKSNDKSLRATWTYPQSIFKERYRIDVLLPFQLNTLIKDSSLIFKGRVPEMSQAAIDFYEGISIAIDTLQAMGYKTDIYVHDIPNDAYWTANKIKDSFAASDLILAYISSQSIAPFADYALKQQINFVSVFSPSDAGVKSNPFFILMNPSLQEHCAFMYKSATQELYQQPLVLFKREHTSIDSLACQYLQVDTQAHAVIKVAIEQLPDSSFLATLFQPLKKNKILMPVMDAAYAETVLNKLHQYFPNYLFEVYGMPSWKTLCTPKNTLAWGTSIAIQYSQPYYFEENNNEPVLNFTHRFQAKYSSKPNELNFRAYELIFWLCDLVNKYGAVFNSNLNDKDNSPFTGYNLQFVKNAEGAIDYLENKHLYLYRFQGGTFLVK